MERIIINYNNLHSVDSIYLVDTHTWYYYNFYGVKLALFIHFLPLCFVLLYEYECCPLTSHIYHKINIHAFPWIHVNFTQNIIIMYSSIMVLMLMMIQMSAGMSWLFLFFSVLFCSQFKYMTLNWVCVRPGLDESNTKWVIFLKIAQFLYGDLIRRSKKFALPNIFEFFSRVY